uniref:Uncharacterized protein n=1 Tax=Setaria viridis TaxID=4556 RepID=A0A4U6T1H9_SETVI|nr:hypothetical protein SEVIR_9G284200v2 [Setaria viridis]
MHEAMVELPLRARWQWARPPAASATMAATASTTLGLNGGGTTRRRAAPLATVGLRQGQLMGAAVRACASEPGAAPSRSGTATEAGSHERLLAAPSHPEAVAMRS